MPDACELSAIAFRVQALYGKPGRKISRGERGASSAFKGAGRARRVMSQQVAGARLRKGFTGSSTTRQSLDTVALENALRRPQEGLETRGAGMFVPK
jgi:hypothetical protein